MEKSFERFRLDYAENVKYKYENVFKNTNKLPINEVFIEKNVLSVRQEFPKDFDVTELSDAEIEKKILEKQTEIIPALDKRWLPKCVLYPYVPYIFTMSKEENEGFVTYNKLFLRSLEYLNRCNFHQFWCTILFEPSAALCLRSFVLNPISTFQATYLTEEYLQIYKEIKQNFLLVYKKLVKFKQSEYEHMSHEYGIRCLIDNKLLNLPIVITLAFLYKTSDIEFANELTSIYFNNTSQLDFQIKEMEEFVKQSILILEMVGGNVCGFDEDAVIVPISVEARPAVFRLSWVYSIVNYLLNTISMVHVLFQFYEPAIEMALNLDLPYRMPFIYAHVYHELYELLHNREELKQQKELSDRVFEEINLGRTEFVEVFHVFVSYCLNKTLEHLGDSKLQEHFVEIYLKLLNCALEDDYFICDYDVKYNVASQNETFESCFPIDSARTQYVSECIKRFARHKLLVQIMKLKKKTVEDVFKDFKPLEPPKEEVLEPVAGPSREAVHEGPSESSIEEMIKYVTDMFPHLGDGFVLEALKVYNYNTNDVINAILEENLPPHLYDIPFDSIRIPPEPEPEKPILAYKGKKPGFDDALKLLNDKKEIKELKTIIIEGVQYSNDYTYDDEYDDRYDDDVPIKVEDNPLSDLPTFNPNHEELESDTSSSDDEFDNQGHLVSKTNGESNARRNFCEDPAVIRARREQTFRSKNPRAAAAAASQPKTRDVVGNAKGKGQDKNVLQNRQKKNANKSSRANHSRKSGAQWKRSGGMIPS